MGTDGERAALVSEHNLYTIENGRGDESSPPPPQEGSEPDNILGQFHQDALTQVGMGKYQWMIGVAAGLCFMSDGVQVFIVPYINPNIQAQLCLEDAKVSMFNTVMMVGLAIGALLSSLADQVGRRTVLMYALLVCLAFLTAIAAFPRFDLDLIAAFASSVGLGACYPVACIYLAEFLPQNSRGKLSILMLFWTFGGFFVLFLAYFMLPEPGPILIQKAQRFVSIWHLFYLVAMLPAFFALGLLLFYSESIRFLLYKGKDVSAIKMYQKMFKWSITRSSQYQLTELELPRKVISSKPPPPKSLWNLIIYNISEYFANFKELEKRHNMIPLVLLSLTWAALGFSYYGMTAWVPQRLQHFKDIDYFSQTKIVRDTLEFGKTYNYGLENQLFENVTFESCVFSSVISHVIFKNCVFNNTDFTGIYSSKTYFIDSTIENTRVYDTDFTDDRFINVKFNQVSYYSEPPCRNDLDFRIKKKDKLTENLLRLISPLVALTIHNLCLYKFSRNKVGGASMLLCSLMSIACWFLNDEISVLVFDFVFSIIFLFCFNSVNIITVEAFPVHIRASSFGICFALFRLFGLLSSYVALTIPMTITLLLIGGIALFRLQDTSFNLISPTKDPLLPKARCELIDILGSKYEAEKREETTHRF